MYSILICLAVFLVPASAWFPGLDKTIRSETGADLFNSPEASNITDKRWLYGSGKLRGVNLGSLFVIEPWLSSSVWTNMGCGDAKSEFDCVIKLGQTQANKVFQAHWDSWITQADIAQMQSYGLNTIRIPVGYWMLESLVYADSEYFPQGAFTRLQRVCGWASDAGFYIIIDMHGAPGAQVKENPFTGQYAPSPGFYVSWQYDRGVKFLSWLTTQIHTINSFRNVGMIGIVNEPVQDANAVATMRSTFYPNAFSAIRAAESSLGVTSNNYLHIQPMNAQWGSGDPNQYLTNLYFAAYDDHRYLKWAGTPVSQSSYISTSCSDNRGGNTPTVVGEFSLSVPDNVQWTDGWHPNTQQAFYKKWFAAQVIAYERYTIGWIFWTWKAQLGDYRWSYQDAVAAGVVPRNPQDVYGYSPC
ncbi:putative endo-beta-1,6-glucanase [Bisporella sp. PMI_857]|nr:putative endo-beta-1,6-glucanase [Bisporella sp. PMI_857]